MPALGATSHDDWRNRGTALLLLAILALAGAVRMTGLTRHGLVLDEIWTVEVATGRGSAHQQLPFNQLIDAPELFKLSNAPPWCRIWTRMELTQPPLYWILLRWWEDAFGDSNSTVRLFSLVTSVLAIALFFDAVRLHHGVTTAAWAATLMALASPQVEYGRMARNYALLLLLALAMANAILRIEHLGFTRRRWWGLLLATFATLLTHYFCIGVIIALLGYCAVRFTGVQRRRTLSALVIGGILFAIIWGPFMWKQSRLFSTSDEATDFLTHDLPHHVLNTIQRALSAPLSMLFPPRDPMRIIATLSSVLFVLPLLLIRRRPELLIWGLWLIGSVAVITALDLTRNTTHLIFTRYIILAGPPVYVLLPELFSRMKKTRWLRFAVPAAAVIACALALPDLAVTSLADPSEVISGMTGRVGSNDLLIFIAAPNKRLSPTLQYLTIDRCLAPLACKVVILNAPADAVVQACISRSTHVYVFMEEPNWRAVLPGDSYHPFEPRMYPGFGLRMQLK